MTTSTTKIRFGGPGLPNGTKTWFTHARTGAQIFCKPGDEHPKADLLEPELKSLLERKMVQEIGGAGATQPRGGKTDGPQ